MTCADRTVAIARWREGTLDEAEARALEAHAATCEACGSALESVSRIDIPIAEVTPPVALRAATLAAVARQRSLRRWRRGALTAGGIAAAVVVLLVSSPREKRGTDFPGASSQLLAGKLAGPSISALDAAEAEVAAAVRQAPDDPDLLGRLRQIRSQRDALRHLIAEAPD